MCKKNDVLSKIIKNEAKINEIDITMNTEIDIVLEGARSDKSDEGIIFNYNSPEGGFIYGYAIYLNEEEKKEFFSEVYDKKANNISSIENMKEIPGYKDFYPLYWGVSGTVSQRFNAHLKGHKNNNLGLSDFNFLNGKTFYHSFLWVNKHRDLEKKLQKKFPPIMKTRNLKESGYEKNYS